MGRIHPNEEQNKAKAVNCDALSNVPKGSSTLVSEKSNKRSLARFNCTNCESDFNSAIKLKEHLMNQHENKYIAKNP